MSIKQQMAQEEMRSADFLSKLNKFKTKSKESKERTKINAHKLEWFKQFRNMQKREQTLDDELSKFMQSNPLLRKEKQKEMQSTY
jgi:hypothetical protein